MAYVTIMPPPGLYHNGTIYQAKGRWYDGSLVRFEQDGIRPVKGWQVHSSTAAALSGACRAVLTWRDNSASRWIGAGTSSKLYVMNEAGALSDITPVGYTVGRDDAAINLGYGGGLYGGGFYGTDRPNTGQYLPATVWTLAPWGEQMVGCADSDGKIYLWALNPTTPAAVVGAAPVGVAAILVTAEGFVMALGQTGDARRAAWCDQQDITTWAPSSTNQAGDYDLNTSGTLQVGRALPSGALLLTDTDAWTASYIGAPLIYGFQRVGEGCGIIAKGAVATLDARAVWQGAGGFWLFDGQSVQPLDCDVADKVFGDITTSQISKVTAVRLAAQGEVWWFYPSAAATENDRYVCWAYRESQRLGRNVWSYGALSRLAGADRGVYPTPFMVDASGYLYEHEVGFNYSGATPYLETGPFEIGQGDYMAEIQRIIPDELTDGDLTTTLYGRPWPNGAETTSGPYSLTSPTDFLYQAREIRLRFTAAVLSDWRLGAMRLEVGRGDPI